MEFVLVFFGMCLIFLSMYGYYRLCKWLTYDFFCETPKKTDDWIKDYVIVYSRQVLGIVLLFPIAIFLLLIFIASGSKGSNKSFNKNIHSNHIDDEEYVIQYRRGRTWINGPASNDERTAENMFDQFLETDPRAENRCRLVHKINGRIQSVMSTN